MNAAEAQTLIDSIPELAEKNRQTAKEIFDLDLDYSAESVKRLDQLIQEGWPAGPPILIDQVVAGLGSYLGETILRLHGGSWKFTAEDGIYLDVGNTNTKIWPFAKVKKRFLNGEEDSLGFYYAVIRNELEKATPSTVPIPPLLSSSTPPIMVPQSKPRRTGYLLVTLILGLLFAGFVGYRVVQFVRYARSHPRTAQPGEAEFREANRLIIAGNEGGAFGNSPAAIALAKKYSQGLKVLRENLFTEGGKTALAPLEGDFLTYCQLNADSCVFLVHVPELRKFNTDAKKSMNELAWINAQALLQAHTNPPATVVVGVKGLMLYDAILIGDFDADTKSGLDSIQERGAGLEDMKLFYPFFAPPLTTTPSVSATTNATSITNGEFKVVSAKFGARSRLADVTSRVSELLQQHPEGFTANAQNLGADPLPGKRKHLTVHYEYLGVTRSYTVQGGQTINLIALTNPPTP
jgi:hypothetical protein